MKKTYSQSRPITWNRFTGKGYCAFASLHRQVCIGVLSVATLSVAAQKEANTNDVVSAQETLLTSMDDQEMEEVTVSGTMAPLTQLQQARMVSVLTRADIEQSGAQSVNDLLKLASGVDVRQRGGFGIQTDISIDGGIFDQITLLLNGVNISNPQTGHLSADFLVSISDIERIEVLGGAASRVYGGTSFSGAINIVTRRGRENNLEVGAEGGMHGTMQADARLEIIRGRFGNRISGGGGRSDGGTENSDWKKGQVFYQGDWQNDQLKLDWQFGFSGKSYGASTFYSASYPNQYERNEHYLLSVSGETKGRFHFTPCIYWQRNYDNFELKRGERFGENFHRSEAYGVKLGGYINWKLGRTAVGADVRHEGIVSTNLGRDLDSSRYIAVAGEDAIFYTRQDQRTTISYQLEHNVLLNHWTISMGLMGCTTPAFEARHRFYPGVDISYRPADGWKIFASYNNGYRLPSFTELYYKSATHQGNQNLKVEENHSLQIGAQWSRQGFRASVRGFFHRGSDVIDWVMYGPSDTYHSTAFKLDNIGVQVASRIDFPELMKKNTWIRTFDFGYTYIHQKRHDEYPIYKSNYALEYLRHKFVASLNHHIFSRLSASWSLRWQDRMGIYIRQGETVPYEPFVTLDGKLQWTEEKYDIYVKCSNLTNHQYFDLGNVPQPGAWVMAGARYRFKW